LIDSILEYIPRFGQVNEVLPSSYIMGVYNPALEDRQSFSFRTNNTHLEVSVWDEKSTKFVKVEPKSVSSICEGQRVNTKTFLDEETGESTDTCDVFVTHAVQALSTTFFEVKHNSDFVDTALLAEPTAEDQSIENEHTKVIVGKVDEEKGIITLRKIDKNAERKGLAGFEQVFTF